MSKCKSKKKRGYTQAPVVIDPGLRCPHCQECHGHRIVNTYRNGNRRRICGGCGKPFITRRKDEKD